VLATRLPVFEEGVYIRAVDAAILVYICPGGCDFPIGEEGFYIGAVDAAILGLSTDTGLAQGN